VHLVFDIFQGIGVAAAVGIRPFLPALAVGALAAGDVQIHFKGTDYSFLQGVPFLLGMALAAIAVALIERRNRTSTSTRSPLSIALATAGLVLGALFFAGSLCRGHYTVWPGFPGGLVCAAVGIAATRPLFARVRARLDEATASALPVYAEGAALGLAALSVVAPPVGPIGLAVLIWLLFAGRGREGGKFAGLRILR
jgi:uncharacterized membrane protein YgdD (TMEM256/DUF423 family)